MEEKARERSLMRTSKTVRVRVVYLPITWNLPAPLPEFWAVLSPDEGMSWPLILSFTPQVRESAQSIFEPVKCHKFSATFRDCPFLVSESSLSAEHTSWLSLSNLGSYRASRRPPGRDWSFHACVLPRGSHEPVFGRNQNNVLPRSRFRVYLPRSLKMLLKESITSPACCLKQKLVGIRRFGGCSFHAHGTP